MQFNGTRMQRDRLLAEVPGIVVPGAEVLGELYFEMGDDARKFILLSSMYMAALKIGGHVIEWTFVERAVENDGWSRTQMDFFVAMAELNGVWRG